MYEPTQVLYIVQCHDRYSTCTVAISCILTCTQTVTERTTVILNNVNAIWITLGEQLLSISQVNLHNSNCVSVATMCNYTL